MSKEPIHVFVEIDIVVYGATGFTGQLVAEYLGRPLQGR